MTTVALNNLWTYIQSMELSSRNKQWLADRLIESKSTSKKPNADTIHAIRETRSGKYAGTLDMQTFDSFLNSIDSAQ